MLNLQVFGEIGLITLQTSSPKYLKKTYSGAFMDSRLRGNDKEISITTQSWVPVIPAKRSPSFPWRRESIGHHSDPHWGSFLESTESSMPGSIFQAHLASIQFALNKTIVYWSIRKYSWIISAKFASFGWNGPYYLANFQTKMKQPKIPQEGLFRVRLYGFPPSREWRGAFCENEGNP